MRLARVYDATDGPRILVDRLWPRGIAKAAADWTWRKDLAPSDALRRAYHAGELDRDAFRAAYLDELRPPVAHDVPADAVLVTAAKDPEGSHAAVLRDWLAAVRLRAQQVCQHTRADAVIPSASGCADCLAAGGTWKNLRICITCGHVACCDSSPSKHASAHFGQTGHPVMRSFMPGEDWAWCFVEARTF